MPDPERASHVPDHVHQLDLCPGCEGLRVHGWCADCRGIEPWQELMAWRLREDNLHQAAGPTDRPARPSRERERRV